MSSIIRFANYEDKQEIISFIEKYWKKDHIFVLDSSLFDIVYKNSSGLNFVLGIEDDKIKAILGFIDYLNSEQDVFAAMWRNIGSIMLGMQCMEFLKERKRISCCGINSAVIPLYEYLGIKTGRLKHFYRLNNNISDFRIAKVKNSNQYVCNHKLQNNSNNIRQFYNMKDLLLVIDYKKFDKYPFFKNASYFEKVYFKNPYYDYIVLGIADNNEYNAIVVLREVSVNLKKCIRIIDVIGDECLLLYLKSYIDTLFENRNLEYIDVYEIGISDQILLDMGFVERKKDDENIIPNYFEPFEQKNVEIYYASSLTEGFKMFKGDGDQDRPSKIKNT